MRDDDSVQKKVKEHNNALRLVDETLEHFRLNAKSYMLSYKDCGAPAVATDSLTTECKEIQQERVYNETEEQQLFDDMPELNEEQQEIFDDVAQCVESRSPVTRMSSTPMARQAEARHSCSKGCFS